MIPLDVRMSAPDGRFSAPGGAGSSLAGATWSLSDAIPVGTTAAVALIEHLWAAPLSEALDRAGGKALVETWLDRLDVTRLEQLMGRQ